MLTLPTTGATATQPGRGSDTADPIVSAFDKVRAELLAERNEQGYWVGRLCDSPLSTATAISALVIAEQQSGPLSLDSASDGEFDSLTSAYRGDLSELLLDSLNWLADQQNEDGGWGDTDRSGSNIATTMLVLAAFRLTCVPAAHADLEPRAEAYVREHGGVAGLRKRYGRDKTFAAPILANCALAGIVPWRQVPSLPFELAAMPRRWFKWLRMPVVSYALPALVAIGLVKLVKHPPLNPITRWVRRAVADRCLALVERMQPDSGGFLEATPLTSFVVMALAGAGHADHPVVRRGVEFLLASARGGGAWPIDTDLACWNTTLALNALSEGGRRKAGDERLENERLEDEGVSGRDEPPSALPLPSSIDWLLACQHTEEHPFTGAEPGGWAWTNLSGGVPDADDTPGALLVLARVWQSGDGPPGDGKPSEGPSAGGQSVACDRREEVARSARLAIVWLLNLQNSDGGWPTFCRGWGALPFDRSATDLTAHALRAIAAWRDLEGWRDDATAEVNRRIDQATTAGLSYLAQRQSAEGSWDPLWFGNERRPGESNPVYGTARVLLALNDLSARGVAGIDPAMCVRAAGWLLVQQHACGGWGSDPKAEQTPVATVEETAVALDALLSIAGPSPAIAKRIAAASGWLAEAIERGDHQRPAPIGLYFAKLWYHEKLYPLVFATSALGAALRRRESASGTEPRAPETAAC